MSKKLVNLVKLVVVLVIVGLFIWFIIISPMITFHNNEKKLEEAAKRYYELYSNELPTGERVKEVTLNTLYKKSFIKEDILIPYTNQVCSLNDSWVKVKRVNNIYKYYVFLDCGMIKSSVDHTGPQIKLNGDLEIELGEGEVFEDPGIKSVVDDTDKKMNIDSVTIKGEVDTTKAGSYEITYSAKDSLNNKTTVSRKITVVRRINSLVKNQLGDEKNYKGDPLNNYVRLSNMMFRIYGIDSNENIILVAEEDVANINYTKIDKWLEEVYIPHFTTEAKKLLVESKFCNMQVSEEELDTTKCTSYSEKKYSSAPSIDIINKAADEEGKNFMKTYTMSWTANKASKNKAYTNRNVFFGEARGKNYYADNSIFNYGIRPMIVIKGETLIVNGNGTATDPYIFGETKKAKGGTQLNKRYTGEYITINGDLWRIMETMDDGTTKVISVNTLGEYTDRPTTSSYEGYNYIKYDIKSQVSHAYYINNKASRYVDVSLFSIHEINIPVYKKKIIYGETSKYEKLKVKLTAPSLYDIFSAQNNRTKKTSYSYWLCDTAPDGERIAGAITDIGVPYNDSIPQYYEFGIRVVGFLKKEITISNGDGTYESPYKIK